MFSYLDSYENRMYTLNEKSGHMYPYDAPVACLVMCINMCCAHYTSRLVCCVIYILLLFSLAVMFIVPCYL